MRENFELQNIHEPISYIGYPCFNNWFEVKVNLIIDWNWKLEYWTSLFPKECENCINQTNCATEIASRYSDIITDYIKENWLPSDKNIRDDNQI